MRRMGIGLGVGINRSNYAQGIFGAYATRVVADGGITEAGQCVDAVTGILLNASLLLIPSGYKGGKLYSEIPTNGNGDLTWTRTSTAIRTNSSSLLESMATGVPRLSYMYGSCPSALLEPQRTNLVLRSEEFDNASWLKLGGSSVTANTTTAPNGTLTADTLSLTTNPSSSVAQSISFATTTTITISVYAKVASGTKDFRLRTDNPTTTQSFTATTSWQRFSMTATPTGNTSAYVINDLAGTAGDLFIWGFQVEVGAYPTTYIPTTSATATRVADSASKTGISSLIGQSEGTVFLDFIFKTPDSSVGGQIGISDSSKANRVILWNNSAFNTLAIQLKANNVNAINNVSLGTFVDGTRYKIAIAYKSGDTVVYVNGTQTITNTSSFTFASSLTDFILGSYETTLNNGHQFCFKTALFTSRLTNAELATLTT